MPYTIEKVIPLRLMKTKLFYPAYMQNDIYHNSALFILTKDIDDTISFLNNNKFLVNRNTFISYYTEKDFTFFTNEASTINEPFMKTMLESKFDGDNNDLYYDLDDSRVFFPDKVDEILNEDFKMNQNYPSIFRNLLYNERIKNQKEIFEIYDKVKSKVPFIRNTFVNLKQYNKKNLIIDLSHYINIFLKNNKVYQRDRGLDLLHHIITRYLDDSRINQYYSRKTCIIPVESWIPKGCDIFDFNNSINPFSMIYRLVRQRQVISNYWNGIDFIIASKNAYFKVDFSNFDIKDLIRFVFFTKKLIKNDLSNADDAEYNPDTSDSIVMDNRFGATKSKKKNNSDSISAKASFNPDDLDDDGFNDDGTPKEKSEEEQEEESQENELKEITVDNDEDYIKDVILDLDNPPITKITEARRKRMEQLDKDFDKTVIHGKKVGDILKNYYTKKRELKPEVIPIDSINEEWKDVTALDFNKSYDIDEDIIAIFKSLRNKSRPLCVASMEMTDASTNEDYIYTLKVQLEDINGTRSKVVIDIPKFINHRFMKLRGNTKTIAGQILLLPIIKTDEDTTQIVTSYHKIFISRVNPSGGTKSTKGVSKLTKALKNLKDTDSKVKVYIGDNTFILSKYDMPIEFKDLGALYSKITTSDGSYIAFDYDALKKLPVDKKFNEKTDILIGYDNKTKKAIYSNKENVAYTIGKFLASKDKVFAETYALAKPSNKLSYSQASIMNTKIPVIILMAFSEGLQKSMDKAKIKYRFSDTRPKVTETESVIRFSDGYLVYNDEKPEDSLLMAGLAKTDLSRFSIKDINTKNMWLDILDEFGGRIKADGFDNFYDCEFDPMTIDICKKYGIPYDYIEALAYASSLLASTSYNKHADISGNRLRSNEILAGYLYQAIANAYGQYANKSKRTGRGVKFTIKQSALIDAVMKDPGISDLSISSPLLEAEAINTYSFKGLSGMNADRAYTLDKRVYDDSMLGILSMSTGFAGNVGITRQATINSSIADGRGILKVTSDKSKLNTLNGMSVYEAMAPYATTHDDPIRTAMGYIQTTKHIMRVKSSSPNLITYGMDEALPYFTSNIFSYKFKGVKGKVLNITDDFIIFEEVDKDGNKSKHSVDLREKTQKNSDGGFYVTVKLKPFVKKGQTLKYNDILAYDPTSFSPSIGHNADNKNVAFNIGTMAKIAIMCTDEAYEDSSIIDERISDALTSFYCVEKTCSLDAGSNVFFVAEKGKPIEEGAPLIIFQNAFTDDEANTLMKNISDDELELATDFGRIQVHSKITGTLQDIKIFRTCELDELSPSLKKIVSKYENSIKKEKKYLKDNGVTDIEINESVPSTEKLLPEGKFKNLEKGVMFCFYIKCEDKMGVGDKLTYNTAIKGVVKDIMPKGKEPYTDFRPDEPIDALLTSASVNARMTASIISSGSLNKVLMELSRQCKEKLGIKWNNLTNTDNLHD